MLNALAGLLTEVNLPTPRWKERKTPAGRTFWEIVPGELSGSPSAPSAKVTTPTATAVLEREWPADGRFFRSSTGRWLKQTKSGVEGSMNWAQEMLVRAVTQHKPRLMPTAEACESTMGFPVGWTNLARKGTAAELCSASTRSFFAARPAAASEGKSYAGEM